MMPSPISPDFSPNSDAYRAVSRREFLRQAALAISAAAATAALAACGGSTTATPTAAPASGAATAPVNATGATTGTAAASSAVASGSGGKYKLDLGGYMGPAPTGQSVQLRLMRQVYSTAVEQWWKDRDAEWLAAYPNITVQHEQVSYGDLNTKLQTYVAAGSAPDIMMGKGDFIQSYVFNNIALNLSDYMSQAYIDDLTPTVKAQQLVNGKLYASAWETSQTMLSFNKDLFTKAGVQTPPETPDISGAWTWDEFNEASKKLTTALNSGGSGPVWALASSTYGNGGPGSSYWLEAEYTRSLGDPNAPKDSTLYKTYAAVSEDGLTASGYIDTPEAIQGMQFYQNMFKQKFSPTVAAPKQFESGQAAMRFSGISSAVQFKLPETKPPFQYGFAPPPKGKSVFTHTSGDTPIVWAKSKHAAEAAAFLAFLTNDTNRITWHKTWGYTPARVSLFAKIGYDDQVGKLASDLTAHGSPTPQTPGYLEYFSAMNDAVKDIGLGADPASRLHKVAKDIDGLLAKYKK
jgi:multiple sugar transport system substrate-binding protein